MNGKIEVDFSLGIYSLKKIGGFGMSFYIQNVYILNILSSKSRILIFGFPTLGVKHHGRVNIEMCK